MAFNHKGDFTVLRDLTTNRKLTVNGQTFSVYAGDPNSNVTELEGSLLWDSSNKKWWRNTGTSTWISDMDRLTTVENTYVRVTRFASVSNNTGTVSIPASNTVVLDDFGGALDAVVSTLASGRPTFESPRTAGGDIVSTTFNASGDYVLSGTPSATPAAIIYRTRVQFKNFNASDADIVGEYNLEPEHNALQGLNSGDYLHLTSAEKTTFDTLTLNSIDANRNGLTAWTGAATNYYSWASGNPGTLTIEKGVTGVIDNVRVIAAAGQSIQIARDSRPVVYFDSNGTVQQTPYTNVDTWSQYIPILRCVHDIDGAFFAERSDYNYELDAATIRHITTSTGQTISFAPNNGVISRYGTGTGGSATDRQVNITATTLSDGASESYPAVTNGVLVNHTYLDSNFTAYRYSESKEFPMIYINGGTPTAVTSGNFAVSRLFIAKSNLNSSNAQFISEIDTAQYTTLDAAIAACSTTAAGFTFTAPNLSQVGFVIVCNNLSGGYIAKVIPSRKTGIGMLGEGYSGTAHAETIPTEQAAFTGILGTNNSTVNQCLSLLSVGAQPYFGEDLKDPTGFVDQDNLDVAYDATNRTVTLTHSSGKVEYYYRGRKAELTSPWVSSAHTADTNEWYLYCTNGTDFNWSTTVWAFSDIQAAKVTNLNTRRVGMRETHGANLSYAAHQVAHDMIKTYRRSGGAMTQVVLASTTAANRRPFFASTVVQDEDLRTVNAALNSASYTQAYLAGATPGTITFVEGASDIVPLSGNQPFYNQNNAGTFQQTLLSNNSHMNVWVVAMPASSDANSQQYRYIFLQGQTQGSLSAIQSLSSSSLELRSFQAKFPEFVFIHRFIVKFSSGNWTIEFQESLSGSLAAQTGTVTSGLTSVQSDSSFFSGSGTVVSPLSITTNVATAVNLGPITATLTEKTSLVDADMVPMMDSATSNTTKKVSAATLLKPLLINVKDTNSTRLPFVGTNDTLITSSNLTFDSNNSLNTPTLTLSTNVPASNQAVAVAQVGPVINAATEKTTPVDADMVGLMDSAASNVLKKLSWSSIKTKLFDYIRTGVTTAPSAGYIGEIINGVPIASDTTVADGTGYTAASIVLNKGVYTIAAHAVLNCASGSDWVQDVLVGIMSSAGVPSPTDVSTCRYLTETGLAGSYVIVNTCKDIVVSADATTIYLRVFVVNITGTGVSLKTTDQKLVARRVA